MIVTHNVDVIPKLISGGSLLDRSDFQTDNSLHYFTNFLTLITIELLETIHKAEISCKAVEDSQSYLTEGRTTTEQKVDDDHEKLKLFKDAEAASSSTTQSVFMGRPFVDKKKGANQKTSVILNMGGSYQPFTTQDALALSCNMASERKPCYFAEITGITGMRIYSNSNIVHSAT